MLHNVLGRGLRGQTLHNTRRPQRHFAAGAAVVCGVLQPV